MIFIYVENKPDLLSISREEALPALESQVLEIFFKFNSIEDVTLGLFADDLIEIKIQSFSKFIWKVEIINLRNQKNLKIHYSTQKVVQLIKDIFNDVNPLADVELL